MFKDFAKGILGDSLRAEERLDVFELSGTVDPCSLADLFVSLKDLLGMADKIPARDKFELHVEVDGDDPLVLNGSSQGDLESIQSSLEDVDGDSVVCIKLKIIKSLSVGAISVYSLEDLASHWSVQPVRSAMAAIWARFNDGLVFECLEDVAPFGSSTIHFRRRDQIDARPLKYEHRELEELIFKENCYVQGLPGSWVPSDFLLVHRSRFEEVNHLFDRVAFVLCVAFIASAVTVDDSHLIEYRLVGYKSISGKVDTSFGQSALSTLSRIYLWIYGAGSSSDRLGLARNVISLHVDGIESATDSSGVWAAIQSNYQIYLKGNIAAYLEVKSRIAELLVDSTSKAHSMAQGLVVALKGGVATMAAFILGVVVVNGVKDSGVDGFFSATYLSVLVLIVFISTLWMEYEISSAKRFLKDSELAFEEILHGGYAKILDVSEIRDSLAPTVKRNRGFLAGESRKVRLLWLLVAFSVVVFFLFGYLGLSKNHSGKSDYSDLQCFLKDAPPPSDSKLVGCLWPKFGGEKLGY